MPIVKIMISDEGKKIMEAAAAKSENSFSAWARNALFNAARDSTPRSVGRPKTYMYLGKKVSEEEMEAIIEKQRLAREALAAPVSRVSDDELAATLAEADRLNPVMKFDDNGDPITDAAPVSMEGF